MFQALVSLIKYSQINLRFRNKVVRNRVLFFKCPLWLPNTIASSSNTTRRLGYKLGGKEKQRSGGRTPILGGEIQFQCVVQNASKVGCSGRGGVMFLRIIMEFENLVPVRCCLLCPGLSVLWPKLRWGPLKLVKACEV